MKKYICDLCTKEFGNEIKFNFSVRNNEYKISEFFSEPKETNDLCHECFERIQTAMINEIKKIKEVAT